VSDRLLRFAGCTDAADTPPAPEVKLLRVVITPATGEATDVALGATLQLKAIAEYQNAPTADITSIAEWQSSDPASAVVNAAGLVTPGKTGVVDISAIIEQITGIAHVTVSTAAGSASAPPSTPAPTPAPAPTPVSCRASALASSSTDLGPGEQEIRLSASTARTDCRWKAASDASWLTTSKYTTDTVYDPGKSGDGQFVYYVQPNYSLAARVGRIKITFTDGTMLSYTVNQRKATCVYGVSPTEVALPGGGGTGTFAITATPSTCSWMARKEFQGDPAWGFSLSGSGVGDGTGSFAINPTVTQHSGVSFNILIGGADAEAPPAVLTVSLQRLYP
jgi:hypothetical protein